MVLIRQEHVIFKAEAIIANTIRIYIPADCWSPLFAQLGMKALKVERKYVTKQNNRSKKNIKASIL
jgi:hypothetical protein